MAMFDGVKACTIVREVLDQFGQAERPDLAPVKCPVRILYGSKDRILRWPNHYERMRRSLPLADWVCLRGAGHVPMWDSPDVVARAILEHTT
jgi:pimeloyl-ACP methyl ester carboxylesterase